MIHEEICTYELCKLAKEKGFREKCIAHYYDDTKDLYCSSNPQCYNFGGNTSDAPTQSLLQRWLREEKKIYIAISVDIDHDLHRVCFEYGVCYDFDGRTMEYHNSYDSFGQYEDALEDALKWTLENLV